MSSSKLQEGISKFARNSVYYHNFSHRNLLLGSIIGIFTVHTKIPFLISLTFFNKEGKSSEVICKVETKITQSTLQYNKTAHLDLLNIKN